MSSHMPELQFMLDLVSKLGFNPSRSVSSKLTISFYLNLNLTYLNLEKLSMDIFGPKVFDSILIYC